MKIHSALQSRVWLSADDVVGGSGEGLSCRKMLPLSYSELRHMLKAKPRAAGSLNFSQET